MKNSKCGAGSCQQQHVRWRLLVRLFTLFRCTMRKSVGLSYKNRLPTGLVREEFYSAIVKLLCRVHVDVWLSACVGNNACLARYFFFYMKIMFEIRRDIIFIIVSKMWEAVGSMLRFIELLTLASDTQKQCEETLRFY